MTAEQKSAIERLRASRREAEIMIEVGRLRSENAQLAEQIILLRAGYQPAEEVENAGSNSD